MTTPTESARTPGGRLPPRPVIRAAWVIHRAIHRFSRGRRGLRPVSETTWGMMRLKTVGRKTGRERAAILGYYEDGPNLVTMAMNGWGEPEPAWWLNLQANPDTTVELHDRTLAVRGRAATPEERPRLWELWRRYDGDELDAWA
ncbi:MAG: nitroreductase/quinone reductase family protein, partial [Candidatus Limnocylindria bacterium]